MKKETIVIDFNNYDKRYSFKSIEDENQKIVTAQQEGKLVLSFVYDKKTNNVVELTGSLGENIKKNVEKENQLERVEEYSKYAYEEYHPHSKKNVVLNPQMKM
ncbi:MAG: hypothetical protein RSD40_04890 [Bacilli bacterium]